MEKDTNQDVTIMEISEKTDKINNIFHHTKPNVKVNKEADRYNVVYAKAAYKNACCG